MIFCGFTDTLKGVKGYPGKGMRRFIKASIITVITVAVAGCVINVTPDNLIFQSAKTEKLNLTRFQEQAFKDDMSVALKAVSLKSEQGYTLRGIQALYHDAANHRTGRSHRWTLDGCATVARIHFRAKRGMSMKVFRCARTCNP